MSEQQLDEFAAWLAKEFEAADGANLLISKQYFSGRACAFRDAQEYLWILRVKAQQPPVTGVKGKE